MYRYLVMFSYKGNKSYIIYNSVNRQTNSHSENQAFLIHHKSSIFLKGIYIKLQKAF